MFMWYMCAVNEDFIRPAFPIVVRNGTVSDETIQSFRELIFDHYRRFGREFPWRNTRDPYRILVSEIMLQQTQVDRVLKKYLPFIQRFPDIHALHRSSLEEVLALWQGLGYNRRCLALKRSTAIIVERHGGKIPEDLDELLSLPGVGSATAAGIRCFAYGRPALYLETNIRNVYLHLFFPGKEDVRDREILELLEQTMDRQKPREWYFALMDFGSMLKKHVGELNSRSRHYKKQPPFEGSDRQIRGQILNLLLREPGIAEAKLIGRMEREPGRIRRIVSSLEEEGFIEHTGEGYIISH
jgi:A/G-specific adenine glycosylase